MPPFAIVVAADQAGGIGTSGNLPWRLAGDMAYFKKITLGAPPPGTRNAVIMGRITWASIPERFRPLPGRINVVISSNAQLPLPEGVIAAGSLEHALHRLDAMAGVGRVFVIGGGQIYRQALEHRDLDAIYLTRVHGQMDCDTHLQEIPPTFGLVSISGPQTENQISYDFREYRRLSIG